MSYGLRMKSLGAVVVLGAGMLALGGCKSAPPLSQDQAQSMIQAKYDKAAPVPASILVSKVGMGQGIAAGLWKLSRVYPNRYWADYTLTDEGKKSLKLQSGGDVIKWRPESANDKTYSVIVMPMVANHYKVREVGTPEKEVIPGASDALSVSYVESVDLTGVPQALQDIAHNPGNQLSDKKQADFVLENGAWTLHSTE